MTLQRRAFHLLGAGILLAVVGSLFGISEATALAIGALAVVLASGARSLLIRPELKLERVARPTRCNVGEECTVALTLKNHSSKPSPAVDLTEEITDGRTLNLRFKPLQSMGTANYSYALPTFRRGLHRLGPANVQTIDPFRLSSRNVPVDSAETVVAVWPKSWILHPVDLASGVGGQHHPARGAAHPEGDDEFSALQEYTPGDDVRRVHWPSTARLGRPIVRRNEPPAAQSTTIILDARPTLDDSEAFERAVSVVASLIRSSIDTERHQRVITVGSDLPPATLGEAPIEAFNVWELCGNIPLGTSGRAGLLLDQLCSIKRDSPDPDRLTASNQLPGDTRLVNELRGYAGEQAIVVTGCSDERADGAGPVSDAQSWAFQLTMRGFNDVLVVATASPVPGAAETADTREKLFEVLRWDGSLSLPAAWTAHHQGSTMLSSTQATEP